MGSTDTGHEYQRLYSFGVALLAEGICAGRPPVLRQQEFLGTDERSDIDHDVSGSLFHAFSALMNQVTVSGCPTMVEENVGTCWRRNSGPLSRGFPPSSQMHRPAATARQSPAAPSHSF